MTELPANAPSVVFQRLRGTLAPTAPSRKVPSGDFAALLAAQTTALGSTSVPLSAPSGASSLFDPQGSLLDLPSNALSVLARLTPTSLPGGVSAQAVPLLASAASPFLGAVAGPLLARGAVRVSQSDSSEYGSLAEAQRWGGSSCSAASLTAVLRASGRDATVGDVVKVLEANRGITVAQGLVSRPALVATAKAFGLSASDSPMSYDQLVAAANRGPVLIDVTNGKFPEGHWLTVTGADANGVSLVDSSGYKLTRMSRAELTAAWSGRGISLGSTPATAQTASEVASA